jgi:3-hydroxyacyl-CoA dehydrogenase, NAD binding domain
MVRFSHLVMLAKSCDTEFRLYICTVFFLSELLQVIGMRFMNPPPIMKLIEIMRGADKSDELFAAIKFLSER